MWLFFSALLSRVSRRESQKQLQKERQTWPPGIMAIHEKVGKMKDLINLRIEFFLPSGLHGVAPDR